MTERERLIAEFQRQHDGDPWHGPSRAAVLDGITAAQASWRPAADAHSIWELVLHMRSWTREVLRRAKGNARGLPADGDWPATPEPTEAAWRATLESLNAAHEELLAFVRALPDEGFATRVRQTAAESIGTGISNLAMLYSLSQHDIYHTGQVAMLKRLAAGAGR